MKQQPGSNRPGRRRAGAVAGNNVQSGDGQGTAPVFGVYAASYYTTNLCPNPSFGTSLAGWAATDVNTSLAQTNLVALAGSQSMAVTTDGSMPGQGTIGPLAPVPVYTGPVIGSMTCSVWGQTGTLYISAVANPGGTVMATSTVTLNGSGWQTVVLNGLHFPQSSLGGTVYLQVITAFAQDITFYLANVMYEPESPAHAFCDGDQPGCTWSGTAELSTSYQQFQYSFSGTLGLFLSGNANFIALGETFPMPAAGVLQFTIRPDAGTVLSVASPLAAMTDFGIWETTDPDPAMTYGWWTNAGTVSGENSYARIYGMVVPPTDYPVSGGQLAWRRAAYGAVGFSWAAVPNGNSQVLTDVQLEYAKTSVGSATTPSTYQRPRQLQVIIKPNRLNYITNPAMQVSTAGWSGMEGNETLAVDTAQFPGNIASYNNLPYSIGQSLRVTLTAGTSQGVQISVPYLIPGETYMCSFYALPGSQMTDIVGSCGTGAGDIASLIDAADGYGAQPYGSGPYGGVNASSVALSQAWVQCSFPFIAEAAGLGTDTCELTISAELMAGANYPTFFWITGVVVEPGDILNPYFDGNSGPDAMWETGGTAGLARSYYYQQLQYGQSVVAATLASNTPLGISYASPLYGVPPTQ